MTDEIKDSDGKNQPNSSSTKNETSTFVKNESGKMETISISRKSIYKFGFFILIVMVAIFLMRGFNSTSAATDVNGKIVNIQSNNVKASESGDVQVAKMKVVNGEYIIQPSSFKVGQKVRIEADISQMPGCSKSIVIKDFGIRKTLTSSSNTIEFTPTKTGKFFITCIMNMYQGQFTVN